MADTNERNHSLLVVDDDVIVRIAIADELRDAGFTVVEARDGAEAISLLESGLRIDAVISDVNMPGPLGGLGIAEQIARRFADTRVILTSGSRDAAREARRLGIPFVAKPYLVSEIMAALATVLQPRETGRNDIRINGNGNTHGGGR